MINFLTLFFPRRCAICDKIVPGEGMICKDCSKEERILAGETCIICGKPLKQGGSHCFDCKRRHHYFKKNIAVFSYESVRAGLYRFKYAGRCEYARFYARETFCTYGREIAAWKADAIIPVPIHKKRRRKRGYNQAEEFALELSKCFSIPVKSDLVRRNLNTKPMKLLSRSERQNNLKKAFLIGKNDVKLNTIILVDDIYTTGTTLDCIAHVCMEAGIRNIYAITIAVGNGL